MQTARTHTRRRAIGQLAGTMTVAAPAVALAGEDPHVEWHREWRALCDWWNGPDEPEKDTEGHPVWDRMTALQDLIADTPAATAPGMLAQIDVALVFLGVEDPSHSWISMEERVLTQLRAALAGRAVA
jgi:hypothetical protein